MAENSIPNLHLQEKQSTPNSARGSVDLLDTTQRQKQILSKYRETNAALIAFKKKTEEAIAAEIALLEHEKKKTAELLDEVTKKNAENLQKLTVEHKQKLSALRSKPGFDRTLALQISQKLSSLRTQNTQVRTEFTVNFSSFMDSFRTAKQFAASNCRSLPHPRLRETFENAKLRVSRLQSITGATCELPPATSPVSLSVSSPERPHPTVSPFLARWFSANAHLLT